MNDKRNPRPWLREWLNKHFLSGLSETGARSNEVAEALMQEISARAAADAALAEAINRVGFASAAVGTAPTTASQRCSDVSGTSRPLLSRLRGLPDPE